MQDKKYNIIRFYRNSFKRTIISKNRSLEECIAHCKREDTQKKDSNGNVIWFDGYSQI